MAKTSSSPSPEPAHELERALVGEWSERIKDAKKCMDGFWKLVSKNRNYANGRELKNFKVRTNLVASTLGTLIPHIYARDPEVSVRPSQSVDPERYSAMQAFSRTCEIVINREFLDGQFKHQAKRVVRSAIVAGMGWVKLGLQCVSGREDDPYLDRKIEDVQDEIDRLGQLLKESDGEDGSKQEVAIAQRTDLLRSMQKNAEAMIVKGFVFDRVGVEDLLWDADLNESIDYRWGRWMAQGSWMRKDQATAMFEMQDDLLASATSYSERTNDIDPKSSTDQSNQPTGTWLRCWEIWDKQEQTVYTWLEGTTCWARPPFTPNYLSRRFYPFFQLMFNAVDGELLPVPDVTQWADLADEYCRTRSAYAEHRRRTIPSRVVDSAVSKGDPSVLDKLRQPEINELVALDLAGESIQGVIGLLPNPPIDQALYDTSAIRNDLDFVSGLQDAAKAVVVQPKTATEANIQQSFTVSRLTEKTDVIEEWVREIAVDMIELALQAYTLPEIQRIAGVEAAWPKLSKDEVYSLVEISVRAGSSGRPNKLEEQQTWAVLLPQVQQISLQIAQYRSKAMTAFLETLQPPAQPQGAPPGMPQGMPPGISPGMPPGVPQGSSAISQLPVNIFNAIADSLEAILRETFRRADERLDPDEFIPKIKLPPITQSVGQPNVNLAPTQALLGGVLGPAGVSVAPAGALQGRVTPGEENTGNLGS